MTSPTDKTETRRDAKKAAGGKLRKNKLRRTGTTPRLFALDKPNPSSSIPMSNSTSSSGI